MASLDQHSASKQFYIRFRFAGRSFKRSLKTQSRPHAEAALARLQETISMLQRGFLELPADADPVKFLLSGGGVRKKLPVSKSVDQLTTHDIQDFINSESKRVIGDRAISPDTIKRHIDTLTCIFNWANKQQLVPKIPMLHGLVAARQRDGIPQSKILHESSTSDWLEFESNVGRVSQHWGCSGLRLALGW